MKGQGVSEGNKWRIPTCQIEISAFAVTYKWKDILISVSSNRINFYYESILPSSSTLDLVFVLMFLKGQEHEIFTSPFFMNQLYIDP